ncbi:hypothetical protein GOBAR_AA40377 [Gossypium barbadense]|uniref:Uncharacterized protein n=1 Tax=Gossypium barbadense TaxID=3634 RepID=A0A2P5VNB2_GOSBA|nr:hypothetical protein GOBAR_AA40377 [Gossypium barbadense]
MRHNRNRGYNNCPNREVKSCVVEGLRALQGNGGCTKGFGVVALMVKCYNSVLGNGANDGADFVSFRGTHALLGVVVNHNCNGETKTYKVVVKKVRKGHMLEREYVVGGTSECTTAEREIRCQRTIVNYWWMILVEAEEVEEGSNSSCLT